MEVLKADGQFNGKKLALSVLVPVVGGSIIGALANRNTQEKYKRLKKPSFSPPPWVFPTVWTTLYTTMGLAKYRVDEKSDSQEERRNTLAPYDIQLGLNFLWSFLFFKRGMRGTALIEMTALLGVLTLTTYEFFGVDKLAGSLMIPYIAWVAFALGLNYSVWKLNKE
ncbi:TspO/MBR family protein [Planococcus massiliensis]|uniref:TspO/MBR family protein n=1 Tax=Planococcus massiliensis TaxID=1499687 RepID=A0A098EQZ7_9BACL|nr:TspO/MBR family protein [Planococcus massiliensis]CEG24215.1 TspO/MBR family protein [Planococcus massiliensis]